MRMGRFCAVVFSVSLCLMFVPEPATHAGDLSPPVPAVKPVASSHDGPVHYSLQDFKKTRKPRLIASRVVGGIGMPGTKPEAARAQKTVAAAPTVSARSVSHYLYSGRVDQAFDAARVHTGAARTPDPVFGWVGGLSAWHKGLYTEAAHMFEHAARAPAASMWMRSAASFWAGRSWAEAGYRKQSVMWFERASAYPDTFYGLLAVRSLGRRLKAALPPLDSKDRDILNLIAQAGTADAAGVSIDPGLIYAIVRQESVFDHRARSRRGARGLMQIMPATAAFIARDIGVDLGRNYEALFTPQVNIKVGRAYLAHLLETDTVDGDLLSLLIAYNAGPGNLARWKKQWAHIEDPLLFIELLPLAETRAYVERVLVYYWQYHLAHGRVSPSLKVMAQREHRRYAGYGWRDLFRVASYR